jgi:hypothetical protein
MRPSTLGRGAAGIWLAGFAVTAALTQNAATQPGIKTDRGVYPLPPAPELPKAGGTFVDPTFGTTIMRVTDEADGKENNNAYSYWPSLNRDGTRFFIHTGSGPTLYGFDPEAFRVLGRGPLFARKPPSNYEPRWESAVWSGQDPDVLFCHEGLNLWAYDVAKQEYTLIKDFSKELPPGHLSQMSKSLDDNVFAFSRQDPQWKLVGYVVWRRGQGKVILREDTTVLDEVQVDKSGRYLVIKSDQQGRGVVQARVADLQTGKTEDLIDNEPDYAPGHSDNGDGTVVGADNWTNRITFRGLAAPHQFRSVLDLHNDWSQDYHLSMLADDERWVLVSFYVGNKLPSSGVFQNEIVQVATDGSQQVRRLAHHRSVFREYWDSPRANISRDGRFVVFTGNWEGTGQRDVFILKVPPVPEP